MAAQADCHTARGPGLSERPAGGVAARRRDRPGLRPGPGRRREGQPGLRPPTAQQSRGLPGLGWPGGPGPACRTRTALFPKFSQARCQGLSKCRKFRSLSELCRI